MKDPDLSGPAARAWKSPHGEEGAGRGAWVVHAPGSHPLWPWHAISAVHLRPVEGMPPPNLRFPGASHEVLVLALNPDHYPPDPDGYLRWLMPPDVAAQVMGLTDDQARQLVELCAKAVCQGLLVPDSDHRAAWDQTIALTAEHMRLEGHPT